LEGTGQVAYYDNGIGTHSFKPYALFGGIFGLGLKRNVLECYKFLCRNHEPDSEIFLFGFSRGAFTMRVLIELISSQGVIPYHDNEEELELHALTAFRAYRKRLHTITRYESILRVLRDLFKKSLYEKLRGQDIPTVRFVGLWDTVAAYGLPFEELTKTFSIWVYPFQLGSNRLPPQVTRVCHALALDEERTTFNPLLLGMQECSPASPEEFGVRHVRHERISEVWFPGVHGNVGGGYPDDSLAFISLSWMLNEASQCGLKFKEPPKSDPHSLRQIESKQDIDGQLYDSWSGLAAYYRYGPRNLSEMLSGMA
jgi:uncharacterized protein (DUF2235 family)